jgi:hypothetical protein
MFNCDMTSRQLKKQTAAVMPLEVMKWQNYFYDDIMSDASLQDRTISHSASSCKLYQRILGTFWSSYIYIFLACQSNLTSAHVTVKNVTNVPYNNINFLCNVYSMSDFLLILPMYRTFW